VLPFVNVSPDPSNEYFSDGLADQLIQDLLRIPGLGVPSRSSSFQFKHKNVDVREVGRVLGVAGVLEGSVRRDGGRVRIAVQLDRVSDGLSIWSKTWDREVRDLFAIQDEIGAEVVRALRPGGAVPLVRTLHHPANVEAYDLYLQGLYHRGRVFKSSLDKAIDAFQRAIDKDPAYAAAYAGLAHSMWRWASAARCARATAFPRRRQLPPGR